MQTYTESPKKQVAGRTRQVIIALDRGIFVLTRHWLAIVNLFLGVYVGLPFLAPVLWRAGQTLPATVIYKAYGATCHQLGFRSWYLFGAQAAYPRAEFKARTGLDPDTYDGFLGARAFIGNAQMGYKVALCERDVATYLAMLACGLVYALPPVRRRLKPLHWALWILIGIVPIGLDGFSQLFTNYPYNAFPVFSLLPERESTPLLRSLTGGLFGLANAWLAYPYFEQAMQEVRLELTAKLARVDRENGQRAAAPVPDPGE